MKKVLILVLFGFASALGCHSIAATASEQDKWAGIDEMVLNALETFKIPGGAVGIVVKGQVVLVKGYGVRDREQNLPVTENTLFAIGSCTKAFTSFVLGQLVDEAVIAWDDPVIMHLPEFLLKDHHATHHATIRDLIAHRSGLPKHDFVWYNSDFPRSDLLNRLQHLDYSSDLREKFQYNNLMYGIAGLVIEKASKKTWEHALKSRILDPLGMDRSNFSVEASQLSGDFALPYWEINGRVERVPFRKITNTGPAASINSSAADMVKWLQLQLFNGSFAEREFIKKATLQEMHTLQMPIPAYPDESIYSFGYGLGWMIGIYKGHYCVSHVGGVDGFISNVALLPKDGIGVVVLSNNSSHGFKFVTAVTNAILDRSINETETNWVAHVKEKYSQVIAPIKKIKVEIINNDQEISLSQNTLKNLAFDKEAAQNFCLEQATIAERQSASEDKNFAAKPTLPKTDSSDCFGVSVFDDYLGNYENPGYGVIRIYLEDGFLNAEYNQICLPLQYNHSDLFISSFTSPLSVFSLDHLPFQFFRLSSGEVIEILIPFEASVEPISFKKKS